MSHIVIALKRANGERRFNVVDELRHVRALEAREIRECAAAAPAQSALSAGDPAAKGRYGYVRIIQVACPKE